MTVFFNQAAADEISAPAQWDLSALFHSPNDPKLEQVLQAVREQAHNFATRYENRLASVSAGEIGEALRAFQALQQEAAKPAAFASLVFAADSSPENGAFLQSVREAVTQATLPLLFFVLELQRLPLPHLDALINDDELVEFRYVLETLRQNADFCLSLPEERILEETANTGRRAFVRLYEETNARLRFLLPDAENGMQNLTLSQITDLQSHPDRNVRQASADALTSGLELTMGTLTFLFNTLIQNKATEDRLRGFTFPEQARHLSNDLPDSIVETVVQTAEAGYGLVACFYNAKRGLLGLPTLAHYDRYAPLPSQEPDPVVPFDTARTQILGAFRAFDSTYAGAAQAFFDNQWIDAIPRPNKRGGAFCSFVTPDLHPVIFMNYLNKSGDVKTLAHELGHGVHSYLSRQNGFLTCHGTLPLAEVASTFAEILVFDSLKNEGTAQTRLSAYARQIDQSIATIFRQAALYRFEQALHKERQSGELSTRRIGELWQEKVGAMFAGSVVMEPGHALWWAYIRHFIATPFYVYAYTFGEMLALALFRKYQTEGPENFVPRYLDFLHAGGSKSPQDLMTPLGVHLDDPAFWQGALHVLANEITDFERLAAQTP